MREEPINGRGFVRKPPREMNTVETQIQNKSRASLQPTLYLVDYTCGLFFPTPSLLGRKASAEKGGGAEKEGTVRPDPRESKLGPRETTFLSRILAQVCEALQTQIRGGGWREGGSAGWQALAPKRRRRHRHRSNGRLGLPPPPHHVAHALARIPHGRALSLELRLPHPVGRALDVLVRCACGR